MDEQQVRRWRSWHRWAALAMLAFAFLAVTTAADKDRHLTCKADPLTLNELRRLFDALVLGAIATAEHVIGWVNLAPKHQATARKCHYRPQV